MFKKSKIAALLIFTGLIAFTVISCDPTSKYEKEELALIQNYLRENPDLAFEIQPSGLYFLTMQEGSGITPVKNDSVFVKYTGKFLNGTIFDTNVGTSDTLGFPIGIGWAISGMDEGIGKMKVGQKAKLLIPSNLAYGSTGVRDYYTGIVYINGFTPLLFDVELVKVIPASVK